MPFPAIAARETDDGAKPARRHRHQQRQDNSRHLKQKRQNPTKRLLKQCHQRPSPAIIRRIFVRPKGCMFFAQVGKLRHKAGPEPLGLRLLGGDIGPGYLGACRLLAKAHHRITDCIDPASDIGCKSLAHPGRKCHLRQGVIKVCNDLLALASARRVGRWSTRFGAEIALRQKGKGLLKRGKVICAKFRFKPLGLLGHDRAQSGIKIERRPPRGNRVLTQGQSLPGSVQRRGVKHPDFGAHGMDITLKLRLMIALKHQPLQIAGRAKLKLAA
ncbi:hypothetical protein TH468_01565 [Thalassospira sp. MCCC 1A03138]|nr:hypothetical protein TH468_01565 [Thalassospira sp. MCCC 1A03138]